jgi:Na+/H+ antiporter NhaB
MIINAHEKGQLSIYLLFMFLIIIVISGIFIKEIYNIDKTKQDLNQKYIGKETKDILTILNSVKKSTIKESIIGTYILDSDINLKDHYG